MNLRLVVRSWRQSLALATGLVVMAGLGLTRGHAQSQPERTRRLAEAQRYKEDAFQFVNAGKVEESVAACEKCLAIERELLGNLDEELVTSLQLLALLHEAREDWERSRNALKEVLAIRERQPDRKPWRVEDARRAVADLDRHAAMTRDQRGRLGRAYELDGMVRAQYRSGDYQKVKAAASECIEIRRELLGEAHQEYAASLNTLAIVCQARGEYARAELLHRQAIAIREKVLGEDHPDHAQSLNALAELYRETGAYARAEPLCLRAIAIRKKTLGEDSLQYATSLNNLATLYLARSEYARAEPLYRQAIAIKKKALGEADPDYAACLNNLALLYRKTGEYRRAEALYIQALEVTKKALGENQPQYATSLNNLATVYMITSNYARAEPLYRRVIALMKQLLGGDHPQYAMCLNNLAALYHARGEYARAEPLFRESVEIIKKTLGESHPEYAKTLSNLAIVYDARGEFARAEPLYRQAIEIRRKALGENHPDYAQSLTSLALLYDARGDYAQSEPLYRQAMEITRRALGEGHPDYAQSLSNLAERYRIRGEYARAEPLFLRALEITKKSLGEGHPDYAMNLNNLALLYETKGEPTRGEALYRQALEIHRTALGENHPKYATSLNNLAERYRFRGEYARAEPLYHQAMEIRRKALGEDHPDYAVSLNNLGLLYFSRGDYARAEPLFRKAISIAKTLLGEGHSLHATSLNNLAELYRTTGDFARAEPLYRQVLGIMKTAQGENHVDYAMCLNNLAMLYYLIGDYARAEPLLLQTMEIRKKALGAGHRDYAMSLSNLAILYFTRGDYARAEPLSRQATEINRKALGADHPEYATTLNNLAMLYRATEDYARAEPLFLRAMEIRKKALGAGHPDYAASLNNLADLYLAMGEPARAEPLFYLALEISKNALGEDHPDYASGLSNLAALHEVSGDYSGAAPLISEALEKKTAFIRNTSASLGERQRLRLLADQRHNLDAYLSIPPTAGLRPDDYYRHVLAWKGTVEIQQAEDRLARDQPEMATTLEQLARARASFVALAFREPSEAQRAAWRRQLDELRARKEDLEADLARRSAALRLPQARLPGPADIAAALPEDVALVDFLVYSHHTRPESGQGDVRRERRLVAFVARRGRPVALVPFGAAPPIDAGVDAWRQALEGHRPDGLDAAAAELHRRIWTPLRVHLAGARTVLIAPDGALGRFPFAALPGSRPRSYLIEELAIGYVGSGRQAIEVLASPSGLAGRGLLAVGDVDFAADPGRTAPRDRASHAMALAPAPVVASRAGFRPLPATGPEARTARDLFHAAFADQPAELLTGAQPTEAKMKKLLAGGRWRVLHLATHGFFESPARLVALRADVRGEVPRAGPLRAARDDQDLAFELTPLLRSGVVLAGGGRGPGTGVATTDASVDAASPDDGILTAEEVEALDLRGCDLVVLSACETALGVQEGGQGVLGLQRAFHLAGARAVIASLWKVDDDATGVLMERFYANLWTRKLPTLEALRQAQLAVLNDPGLVERHREARGLRRTPVKPPSGRTDRRRSDPSLWAAFVLGGDGR